MSKIYLAGPMSGIPEFNYPLFKEVTAKLRAQGHEVFSPAEADDRRHGTDISKGNKNGDPKQAAKEHGFSLRDALCEDLTYICKEADTIVLLPGWERSFGSGAEWATARALNLNFIYWRE